MSNKIKAVSLQPGSDPVIVSIDKTSIGDIYQYTDGPYVEAVNHWDLGVTMFCNEDGHQKRLAPNPLATDLFNEVGVNVYGGSVLGGVIVTGLADDDGDITDVTAEFLARVGLRSN